MAAKSQEKRGLRRLELNMPVDLKRLDLLDQAIIGDITPHGVFIATDKSIAPGTELEIELKFPANGASGNTLSKPTAVTVMGEVVWNGPKQSAPGSPPTQGIGVRFTNMNAETFEIIQALYERLDAKLV